MGSLRPNAYQFYSFDEMKKYKWPQDFINSLRTLLPTSVACHSCGGIASFTWVSPEMRFNNYLDNAILRQVDYVIVGE